MNLNYMYILAYMYFQLFSTIVGQRKLTNSVSNKKIHSTSQTNKSLHSECCVVLLSVSYSYTELLGTVLTTFTQTYLIILKLFCHKYTLFGNKPVQKMHFHVFDRTFIHRVVQNFL